MVTCAHLPKNVQNCRPPIARNLAGTVRRRFRQDTSTSLFHPTGITVAVVLIAKFTGGVLLIPALILSGERLLDSAHC